jgi:hypothetical protein
VQTPGSESSDSRLSLRLRDERSYRVDHDQIHGTAPYQRLRDVERLFAGIGLTDQEVLEVDAERLGVLRIERVLGVDEGCDSAGARVEAARACWRRRIGRLTKQSYF